jgi:hypothetical protein
VALSLLGGVILLIVGLVLRGHYGSLNAMCYSPLGSVGQAVVPNAQNQCGLYNDLLTLGDCLTGLGGVVILIALITTFTLRQRPRSNSGWRPLDDGSS